MSSVIWNAIPSARPNRPSPPRRRCRAGRRPRTASRSSARSARGSPRRVVSGSCACRRCIASPRARQSAASASSATASRRPSRRAPRTRGRTGSRPSPAPRRAVADHADARPRRNSAPSIRSSWTSVAMWTSSTAAPAATEARSPGGAARKTSSGRSRLPPAASASRADRGRRDPDALHRRLQPLLELLEVGVQPGRLADRRERVTPSPPRCAARRSRRRTVRHRTSSKPGRAQQRRELVRAGEPAHARRQVRVRGAALQHLPEQRDEPVEPEPVERREHAAGLRDLEDRRRRPPGASTRRELGEPALEVGDVADAEPDRRRVEARRPRTAARARRPGPTRSRVDFAPRALEHPRREVEPGDGAARRARRDREVAGAAARVEHAGRPPHDRAAVARRQRWSSPTVITRFITS